MDNKCTEDVDQPCPYQSPTSNANYEIHMSSLRFAQKTTSQKVNETEVTDFTIFLPHTVNELVRVAIFNEECLSLNSVYLANIASGITGIC